MKLKISHILLAGAMAVGALSMGSCTEKIAFGNAFLEKAPGGSVTADTVFNNAEYTRQFLANCYTYQYYNLPTRSSNDAPQCLNYWKGMPDMLGDTHTTMYTATIVAGSYYNGSLTSVYGASGNGNIYPYGNEAIWTNIRKSLLLIEKIDGVPGMSEAEKASVRDQAKCLLAYQYFWAMRFYGGLPVLRHTFDGSESEYEGRCSIKETFEYIIEVLDEVIAANALPWGYTGSEAQAETGRWTIAGAMALKIATLQFVAAPLLNSEQAYWHGKYSPEHPEYTWLGGYDATLWTRLKDACAAFFQNLNGKGVYHLVQPAADTQEAYRYAFRQGYLYESSPETLYSCRVSTSANSNDYNWWNLGHGNNADGTSINARCHPNPTAEYAEMFPWRDGRNFNWEKDKEAGLFNEMFIKGTRVDDQQYLQNVQYTRDPRMYETMGVNGARYNVTIADGTATEPFYEGYVGGTQAGQAPAQGDGTWGTGFINLKYTMGVAFRRQKPQWGALQLPQVYLTYAEALVQSGGSLTEALTYVNAVRARVGLGKIEEMNPELNLTTNRDNLLHEILRERACEGGLEVIRYFDMIRYKLKDDFEKPLHGLRIYRMVREWSDDLGDYTDHYVRTDKAWYSVDRLEWSEGDDEWYEPDHWDYEKFELTVGNRYWWKNGFDPKWYFQPFPNEEVIKGYGLEQNPGW